MGRCLGTGLCAYPKFEVLALRELNVYDESVLPLASGIGEAEGLKKISLKQVNKLCVKQREASICSSESEFGALMLRHVDLSVSGWATLWEGLQGSASVEIIK